MSPMTDQELEERLAKQLFTGSLTGAIDRVIGEVRNIFEDDDRDIHYEDISRSIKVLDGIGFFELRYAVVRTAELLNVSRVTIYKHLRV